jgi:methanogenic corrinoid protein MtbC1
MATVGMGLALSLEGLLQRFPGLRDFGIGRLRRSGTEVSPAALASIIESQVIPRLLVAHLPPVENADWEAHHMASPAPRLDPEAAQRLADAVLDRDIAELLADLDQQMGNGIGPDTILLELLAPAARILGQFWEQDRCDFVDVTMGMWRIQELTHAVAGRLSTRRSMPGPVRRGLFGLIEGDQHQLAPLLVSEFFRAAGWDAINMGDAGHDALIEAVEAEHFDLVGLTISQDPQVERAPLLIEALRERSCNPDLVVMVGGALLCERPELAFLLGADATASDARTAVARAESLLNAYGLTGVRHC